MTAITAAFMMIATAALIVSIFFDMAKFYSRKYGEYE
jgi:hypothetical protein